MTNTPHKWQIKRRYWLLAVIAALTLYACTRNHFMAWETVSSDFMKGNGTEAYGPGDFRIQGNRMVSMRLAMPKTTYKNPTSEELKDPDHVAQETESWMADVSEVLNRTSVSFFAGTVTSSSKTFEHYAQDVAWWLAPDWNTIYLATNWHDYHGFPPENERYKPTINKLWKSTDAGHHWQALPWKVDQHIGFLHFLDANRGYAVGWGPHLWRTLNGGMSWQPIKVPPQALDPSDSRKTFDLVALGANHVLYMAFVPTGSTTGTSLVYALKWGETLPVLAFEVPGQTINNMLADKQGNVYVVSVAGPVYEEDKKTTTLSVWDGHTLNKIYAFKQGLVGYAVYLTPQGHLLVQGADYASLLPKDWTALSTDHGKTWDIERGLSAQGGYYDDVTGIDWRVSGYTLSKRVIP